MKHSNFRVLASLVFLSGALVTTSANGATTIIDWGGNYVSANQNFANEFDESDTNTPSGYGGFSNGDPLSLTPTAGYTGGAIYGSILELPGGAGFGSSLGQVNGIVNNSTSDRIQLKGDDGAFPVAFLLLWKKADFLNGGDSAGISFDVTSSVRVNFITLTEQHATDSGRLVLRLSGGSYYVSDRVFTVLGDVTVDQLSTLNFFEYDPASNLNIDSGSLVGTSIASAGSINGITEIGFYFESGVTTGPDAVRIQDFEVIATTAIPEPSTCASLAGLLGLSMAIMRRRRK